MSSIEKVPGGKWRARWRTPAGASRSRTFDRKVDADRWLTKVGHDALSGAYVDPSAGRISLRTYAAEHISRQPWRPATRDVATRSLRPVLALLGDRPLSSIRASDMQALISGLDVAPSTAKVIAQHLRAVLRSAVRDGLIVKSPGDNLRLPRQERGLVDPLSDEEVARLYEAAAPPFRAAVILGAALGLRQSEAAGLTVDRVDFLRREVRIDRQFSNFGWGPPKTAGSNRVIPVAVPVVQLLARHLEQFGPGEGGALIHWPWAQQTGGPMGSNPWGKSMRPAVKAAGLEGVRYHDLRHHAASRLIASGLSVVAVARFLGHDNPSTTLRTYAHLWGDDNDRIRSAMATAWAPVSPACQEGNVQGL
jgi:integrase